jgi:hypothetical protein
MISVCKCRRSLAETLWWRSHAPAKRKASAKMMLIIPGIGPTRSNCDLFKAADKLIIRFKFSEDGWAIRFLHLRPTEASWVGLGFDRSFDDSHFTTTITILAAVDLMLGHGHRLGDPEFGGLVQSNTHNS